MKSLHYWIDLKNNSKNLKKKNFLDADLDDKLKIHIFANNARIFKMHAVYLLFTLTLGINVDCSCLWREWIQHPCSIYDGGLFDKSQQLEFIRNSSMSSMLFLKFYTIENLIFNLPSVFWLSSNFAQDEITLIQQLFLFTDVLLTYVLLL